MWQSVVNSLDPVGVHIAMINRYDISCSDVHHNLAERRDVKLVTGKITLLSGVCTWIIEGYLL